MPPFDFDPINDGFWGNTTSTLDWCERNYEVPRINYCTNVNISLGELVHCRVLQHSDKSCHGYTWWIWSLSSSQKQFGEKILIQSYDVDDCWCWFNHVSYDTAVRHQTSILRIIHFFIQVLGPNVWWTSNGVQQLYIHLQSVHGLAQIHENWSKLMNLFQTRSKQGDRGGAVMIILIIFSVSFTVGYLMFPFPVILQVLVILFKIVLSMNIAGDVWTDCCGHRDSHSTNIIVFQR